MYKQIWRPLVGEELATEPEPGNNEDSFAVSVVKAGVVVGHLPRQHYRIFWYFIRRGGTIMCTLTRDREHSRDLPQGGLDIPCSLTCRGHIADIKKLRRMTT